MPGFQKNFILTNLRFGQVSFRTRLLLAGIIASAVVLRVVFALITPEYMDEAFGRIRPFNDEYAHLKYVQYLIKYQRMPTNTKIVDLQDPVAWIFNEFEYTQPPLYYVLNIPFALLPKPMLFCRLFSVLLSSLTVILGISATITLFKDRDLAAVVAAILLGFHPILLRIGSSVGNDNLAWLISMILLARYLNGRLWDPPWLSGILIGLGLLTKFSFMIWIPFLLITALLSSHRQVISRLLLDFLSIVVMILLVCGWWFVRNHRVYGDWTGMVGASSPYLITGSLSSIERFINSAVRFTFFPIAEEPVKWMGIATGISIFLIISFLLQYETIKKEFSDSSLFKGLVIFSILNVFLFIAANLRNIFTETRLLFVGLLPLSAIVVACLLRTFQKQAIAASVLMNLIYPLSLW